MPSLFSLTPPALEECGHTENFSLKVLEDETEIYRCIKADFENSGLNVSKIQYVQYHHSWRKYTAAKDIISKRTPQDPSFLLNEKYLYHGTQVDIEILCEEGFDKAFASKGHFGKGLYFSDNPKKCVKYSKDVIIVARVLLGGIKEYEKGDSDKNLIREPLKAAPYKGWRYYDSVKGQPNNHTEFVIYTNDNAFIEYVVTYSKAQDSSSSVDQVLPLQLEKIKISVDDDNVAQSVDPKKQDVLSDSDSSLSSDEDDCNHSTKSTSSSDSEEENTISSDEEPLEYDFVVPSYDIPTEELSLEQKKETFKEMTGEMNDEKVNSILSQTKEDLEIAVYLYFAYKQVKEEEELRLAGGDAFKEEIDNDDDGSPIFPLMEPPYETSAWEELSDDIKKTKTDQVVADFMTATGLDEIFLAEVAEFCVKAKYILDDAMVNFYVSKMQCRRAG